MPARRRASTTNLAIDKDRVAALIADKRIAAVTATGSERAGRSIAEVAGKNGKKVVLELGGSDPFVVFDDADFDKAVTLGITSRFFQQCAKLHRGETLHRFARDLRQICRRLRQGGRRHRHRQSDGRHHQIGTAGQARYPRKHQAPGRRRGEGGGTIVTAGGRSTAGLFLQAHRDHRPRSEGADCL